MFKLRPRGKAAEVSSPSKQNQAGSQSSLWDMLWCAQNFLGRSQLLGASSGDTVMSFLLGKTMKTVVFTTTVFPQESRLESQNSGAAKIPLQGGTSQPRSDGKDGTRTLIFLKVDTSLASFLPTAHTVPRVALLIWAACCDPA